MAAAALLPMRLLGRPAAARPSCSPRPYPAACRAPAPSSALPLLAAAPAAGRRTTAAAASTGGGGGPKKQAEPIEAQEEPWWIAVTVAIAFACFGFVLWFRVVVPNWATWLDNVSLVEVVFLAAGTLATVASAWATIMGAYKRALSFRAEVQAVAVAAEETRAELAGMRADMAGMKESMATAEEVKATAEQVKEVQSILARLERLLTDNISTLQAQNARFSRALGLPNTDS
ncbi:hypothetical protein HYH03_009852 [Edaphochlamys debaryana]|uniref:Uncharacterized protein n=1 Tax=Edaphochlamys debaryana TaxID=47281 RepID=A0A835Y3K3_9CHLO|nr:hypothetical protein HYH03_009852 [Edaphochlamys debaryana]|eukprot:KAG2491900.1 hypothetical protein HYH03_009852 [Edaphochlamys debaryana]